MAFSKNWSFSELFMPKIKMLLGLWLLDYDKIADLTQGTDLLFDYNDGFAVRIRKSKTEFLDKDKKQFTIRTKVISGNRTEIHKLMLHEYKFAKYGFYGFVDEELNNIVHYTIYDISIMRNFLRANKEDMWLYKPSKKNGDGTEFMVYNWTDFQKEMILFSGENTVEQDFQTNKKLYLNGK